MGRNPEKPGRASKSSREGGRDRRLGEVPSAAVESASLVQQRAQSPGGKIWGLTSPARFPGMGLLEYP